jgi:hypothetical protein
MNSETLLTNAIDYVHARYGGTEAALLLARALRAVRESAHMAALASQGIGVIMQKIEATK